MHRPLGLTLFLSTLALAACEVPGGGGPGAAPPPSGPADPVDPDDPALADVGWEAVTGSCEVLRSGAGGHAGQRLGGLLAPLREPGAAFLSLERDPDLGIVAMRRTADGDAALVPFEDARHASWQLWGAGGDADGDGLDDFLAVEPPSVDEGDDGFVVGGGDEPAADAIVSGRDLSVVADLSEALGDGVAHTYLLSADLDGDGVVELLTAEGGGIAVWGLDGGLRWTIDLPFEPFAVTAVGDLDGDGRRDLVDNAPWAGLSAFTMTGEILWDAPEFGTTVVHASPDLDGDGLADLLIADVQSGNGVVRGMGGNDAAILWTHAYALDGLGTSSTAFGLRAAELGDWNDDGIAELLVSGANDNIDQLMSPYGGVVAVLDGASGEALVDLQAAAEETGLEMPPHSLAPHFGSSIVPLGDLDGDDRDEFVVGAEGLTADGQEYAGAWVVFSCSE